MGLKRYTSTCYCEPQTWHVSYDTRNEPPSGNPNPKKFKILKQIPYEGYFILEVQYPDCTNYEGRKIMVFDKFDIADAEQNGLDPHFCDSKHQSPIARFEPTEEGLLNAYLFIKALWLQKKGILL